MTSARRTSRGKSRPMTYNAECGYGVALRPALLVAGLALLVALWGRR